MKKLLSTITAISVITAGIGAQAFNGTRLPKLFAELGIAVTETETAVPTATPTAKPTDAPTATPTAKPMDVPTATPTAKPTDVPTATPTAKPTDVPTATPTAKPTDAPAATPEITPVPTPTQAAPAVCTSISLNKQTLTLKKGESFKLKAATEPENIEDIQWSTSNPCVSISQDGTVTAAYEGDAIVSAMTAGSKIVASCFISVEEDNGTIALSVTEGVKEVVVTRDGLSTEIRAGENNVEAGTYTVSAKAEENYTLSEYSETLTVAKNEKTALTITAARTRFTVTKPTAAGVTVTAVNGSAETVQPGGSYSFAISLGSSYASQNLTVKANGEALTPSNGIYTINNINDDVIITIDGVESKSWDASLKSVTVGGVEAVLGAGNVYSATIPYGDTVKASDIKVTVNDVKSSYTITTVDGVYTITVKAEDGTTAVYTLSIKNSEATAIDNFKVELNSTRFSDITQSSGGSYASQDDERSVIAAKLESIGAKYPSVSYTIENGTAQKPVRGTLSAPTGQDGYYTYTVKLTEDDQTRECEVRIEIIGYDYLVSASNITATATTITVKNVDSNSELALFTNQGGRLRKWTAPTNNSITFSNLAGGETYTVKIRAAGSDEVPAAGTYVTTLKSSARGASSYHTVYFDVGDHGTIVEGKAKQTVGNTRVADYPTVKADDGYIFKGWSSNGVLIENPKTYYIRSTTTFIAVYEAASGSSYSSSKSTGYSSESSSTLYNRSQSTASAMLFNDVPEGSWFYDSVKNISSHGYMNGVTATEFQPNTSLTRAMLVTILYRYACEPNIYTSNSFSDVPEDTWYTDAVTWAADAGIVNGVSDNAFAPNENITREQLAAIIYRYSEAFGYDTSAAGNIIKYSDASDISDWAQRALIWTTGAGIISGKDGNLLDPKGKATRAETATIIERFDNIIENEI